MKPFNKSLYSTRADGTKVKHVGLYAEGDVCDALMRQAAKADRSVSGQVRYYVKCGLIADGEDIDSDAG